MPASDFHTCGEHNYLDIRVTAADCERAKGRTVICGPYMDLPFGHYEFVLKCSSEVETALCHQLIHVRVPNAGKAFELRIYSIPGRPYPTLVLSGLQIIKRASLVGLHQRENMNLLAYLVALRLERAAVSECVVPHAV